jgi:hypothetical protein
MDLKRSACASSARTSRATWRPESRLPSLDMARPLAFYIPAQKKSRKAEVDAMRAAAKELDAMIAAWGASEDDLMQEYKEIRRAGRGKKRNAK